MSDPTKEFLSEIASEAIITVVDAVSAIAFCGAILLVVAIVKGAI
jgi:hypothetical protein